MNPPPSTRQIEAFERRVARALQVHVPHDARVLVACSGGPDSTATLIAVARRHAGHGMVSAAHFDHGLRAADETAADLDAVRDIAKRLGVDVLHGSADTMAGGSEAAARDARYRWLASACAEAGVIWCITGHTLDDQAETVLLRLTRGAGLLGAAGMASVAPWPVPIDRDVLRLVRPLLDIRHAEAAAYLHALGIAARVDSTNWLVDFHRNRLRHRVLPELRTVNPRAEEAIARFANQAREDDAALSAWAEATESAIVQPDGERAVLLLRVGLRALPRAVESRVLRRAAASLGIALDAGQIEALLRLSGRRGARLSLHGGEAVVLDAHLRLAAS